MLTYSRDQLCSLSRNGKPARYVRKAIFAHRLWQPRRSRRQARDSHVNINNAERSADLHQPAFCRIGWLNVTSLLNKTTTVHETIVDKSLDVFVATENWHHSIADVSLRIATQADYRVADAIREADPVSRRCRHLLQATLQVQPSHAATCVVI